MKIGKYGLLFGKLAKLFILQSFPTYGIHLLILDNITTLLWQPYNNSLYQGGYNLYGMEYKCVASNSSS